MNHKVISIFIFQYLLRCLSFLKIFLVSICVVMLALWSLSQIAAHFAFCFTSCVVMLAFWSPSIAARFAFCFTSCDLDWHRDPG